MLTPQEINDKTFKKVTVWGYDMNAVDSFKEKVSEDYAQLYKENITLKSKMKVLIEKIDEYRGVDEQMRKALVQAQTMAAQIVEDAKADVESREKTANERMEQRYTELRQKADAEEARYNAARERTEKFIAHMTEIYGAEGDRLKKVVSNDAALSEPTYEVKMRAPVVEAAPVKEPENVLPDTIPIPGIPPIPEDPNNTKPAEVFEVDISNEKPKKKPVKIDDDEETISLTPKPKFNFDDLKFGDKYKPEK